MKQYLATALALFSLSAITIEANAQFSVYDENGKVLFAMPETPAYVKFVYPGTEAGHKWVDLGLDVMWATTNVGAETPEDYGLYFAWGETTGYTKDTEDGKIFNWENYSLCNGSSETIKKYCKNSMNGTVDNLDELKDDDDAAHVNWGGKWRMPTYAQQKDLRNKCYWVWTESYKETGVKGYIVFKAKHQRDRGKVSNTSSSYKPEEPYMLTDAHIFLPAAGYRFESILNGDGSDGFYWSRSLGENFSSRARELKFYKDKVDYTDTYRLYGRSVRAVCSPTE